MKYSLDKQIENDIINAAKKYGVKKVVLFGSRGDRSWKNGNNHLILYRKVEIYVDFYAEKWHLI